MNYQEDLNVDGDLTEVDLNKTDFIRLVRDRNQGLAFVNTVIKVPVHGHS
jgi:hypothetical protein